MILLASKLIYILLAAVALFINYNFFKNKLSKKRIVYLAALIVCFSFFAKYIVNFIPPLTDQITLEALGGKQEEAKGMEVYLNGYTIDGRKFSAGEFLQIESGHWFWSGERYCWRPETDSRQPDGLTRSIVLHIPVGWERTLNFSGEVWRGKVEVITQNEARIIDTYSVDSIEKQVWIEKSSTQKLILNQLRYLGIYGVALLAFLATLVIIIQKALDNPKHIKLWQKQNSGKLIYAGIAIITACLMIYFANGFTFWNDELLQIGISTDMTQAIQACLKMYDATPPLFTILHTLWYRICPYGERWLQLITIFPIMISIYLIGIIGEHLRDKIFGVISAVILATSTTIWTEAAYNLRAYSFVIFFSLIMLYCFVMQNEKVGTKWKLGFAFSMTFLAMSHYFGILLCAEFFFADLYLIITKKKSWGNIWSYTVPGGIVFVWLIAVFKVTLQTKSLESIASWYPIPGFNQIRSMLQFLSGNLEISYWILMFGIAIAIVQLINNKNQIFSWSIFYKILPAYIILGTFICMVFYGNIINQKSTMWQGRYFLILIPYVCLLSAGAIYECQSVIIKLNKNYILSLSVPLFVSIVLSLNCLASIAVVSVPQTKAAADWLYSQSNYIFNDSTLIITTMDEGAKNGWNNYYLTRQGRRDNLKIFSQYSVELKDEIEKYDRIYLYYYHEEPIDYIAQELNEKYILESNYSNISMSVYKRK